MNYINSAKCVRCGENAAAVINGVYLCAPHALADAKAKSKLKGAETP